MSIPIYQVDAFSEQPFKGNPAAVCFLESPRQDIWMQSVAMEMNLSETAFLTPEADGFRLRWFTPTVEVDLCGHATLASAHVLWESSYVSSDKPIKFFTRSGILSAEKKEGWIYLDFPTSKIEAVDEQEALSDALGIRVIKTVKTDFDLLAEIEGTDRLASLKPDMIKLSSFPTRGIIVTSRSNGQPFDFVSRFFAPNAGVIEDPVTGSAHCALAPYWSNLLGKDHFMAFQSSARGGDLKVELHGSRVYIGGQAVTVFQGQLD